MFKWLLSAPRRWNSRLQLCGDATEASGDVSLWYKHVTFAVSLFHQPGASCLLPNQGIPHSSTHLQLFFKWTCCNHVSTRIKYTIKHLQLTKPILYVGGWTRAPKFPCATSAIRFPVKWLWLQVHGPDPQAPTPQSKSRFTFPPCKDSICRQHKDANARRTFEWLYENAFRMWPNSPLYKTQCISEVIPLRGDYFQLMTDF